MNNEQQTPNSWEIVYNEITKMYLDSIPLSEAVRATYDWRHGITKDQPKLEYPMM